MTDKAISLISQMILTIMYLHYICSIGEVVKNTLSKAVILTVSFVLVIIGDILKLKSLLWLVVVISMFIYDVFFDDTPIKIQYKYILTYGGLVFILNIFSEFIYPIQYNIILNVMMVYLLTHLFIRRKLLSTTSVVLTITIYTIISFCTVYLKKLMSSNQYFLFYILFSILSIFIFIFFEYVYTKLNKNYLSNTKNFENFILSKQYDEIKNIYLNMRGWRHDFHNHIQTMKSYMFLKDYNSVDNYLNKLDSDLNEVDTLVKSGNIMADAILNAKLSIAKEFNIKVDCTANIPEHVIISDVDMCVIFGNLIENSIEACKKIEQEKRFIRIYIDVLNNQLYLSIQNSSKEILDFNEKNYITTKRGEHGFGMKRVQLLVEKYDGFLNLQNEPGVFASEVTLPLKQ